MKTCVFFCALENCRIRMQLFDADANCSQFCDYLQIAAFLWYTSEKRKKNNKIKNWQDILCIHLSRIMNHIQEQQIHYLLSCTYECKRNGRTQS